MENVIEIKVISITSAKKAILSGNLVEIESVIFYNVKNI